eukprot:453968-Pelagomonas_calceolata.AAC.3
MGQGAWSANKGEVPGVPTRGAWTFQSCMRSRSQRASLSFPCAERQRLSTTLRVNKKVVGVQILLAKQAGSALAGITFCSYQVLKASSGWQKLAHYCPARQVTALKWKNAVGLTFKCWKAGGSPIPPNPEQQRTACASAVILSDPTLTQRSPSANPGEQSAPCVLSGVALFNPALVAMRVLSVPYQYSCAQVTSYPCLSGIAR